MARAGPRISSELSNKLQSAEEGLPYVPKKASNLFPPYNRSAPPKNEYEAVFRSPPPVGNPQPVPGIVPSMPKALQRKRHTVKNYMAAAAQTKGGRRKYRKTRKTKMKKRN
jgi:hypothetical protein